MRSPNSITRNPASGPGVASWRNGAGALVRAALPAAAALEEAASLQLVEGVARGAGDQDHVAAAAAVAAVGTAARHVLLARERDAAGAALAGQFDHLTFIGSGLELDPQLLVFQLQ